MDKKILIAVPTAEMARKAEFYDYFNMLEKPPGTAITFSHGQSPARNRNLMIRQALDLECTHIFFLDDDVAFRPDALIKLMKHDVDVVTGLYLMRNYPHQPIIFDKADETGRCAHHFLDDSETGLIPIVACGLGCALINMDIFLELEEPWIRLGELEKDHWCDDIGFFLRVRNAGFKLYCDLSVLVGHNASVTIWPDHVDGKWVTTYSSYGTGEVHVPPCRLASELELVVK